MGDMAETFRAMKKKRQQQSAARRDLASKEFDEAKTEANRNGFALVRNTESHYTLSRVGGWFVEIYPGNQRLYRHPGSGAPHLKLKSGWTVIDVVMAAIDQTKKGL